MDAFRQDLLYALRRLWAAPGFTLVAVLTLALGIGANAALFSIVNGVLLRPLPYPDPDRLVRVVGLYEGKPVVMSPANFLDVRAAAATLEGLAAYDNTAFTLTGGGEPHRVEAAEVTANFFDVLGVRPALGRGFEGGENDPGRAKVVVLGHGLWAQRFAGDPGVLGQAVVLDGQPYTVVGVAAAGFDFPGTTQLWVPMLHDAQFLQARGAVYLGTVARLAADASIEHARAELRGIAERLEAQHKDQNEGLGMGAIPLRDHVVGDVSRALTLLLGAVGFVLLIACVNVANLLLARHAARGHELAVRTALGAARGRIVRQLLTEAVVLGVAGGALGMAVASWGRELLLALQPGDLPRLAETGIDSTVLAFCACLSVLTALLFGAVPALAATRRDPTLALREGGRGLFSRSRLGPSLVVGEVALAATLLAGAGLLLRTFSELRRVDPGFETPKALTFRTALPEALYDDARRLSFYRALEERIAAQPGVTAVGATMALPLSEVRFSISFDVAGRPPLPPAQQPSLEVRVATPGYLRAMGIPLLAGRPFTAGDSREAPPVVLLSREAVRRHFPDEDPIGKHITLGWGSGPGAPKAGGTVVGVVGDVKDHGLAEAHPPEIYLPYAQRPMLNMSLVVRTADDPARLTTAIRATLHDLDPNLPMLRVQTLEDVVSGSIARPRFYALLLAFFAATALALAALGVFGVLSYAVSQRSREIGLRLALGAVPSDLLRMVLGEAVRLVAIGLAIGIPVALLLSRSLASLLFGLTPTDPTTLAGVVIVLGAAALFAAALPAWRAARLDPLHALRIE
jgi:putative ABC transport system permease protein